MKVEKVTRTDIQKIVDPLLSDVLKSLEDKGVKVHTSVVTRRFLRAILHPAVRIMKANKLDFSSFVKICAEVWKRENDTSKALIVMNNNLPN